MFKPQYHKSVFSTLLLSRFFSKITINPQISFNGQNCWIWTGATNSGGYASFRLKGSSGKAYIASYRLFVGDIPDGYEIDHKCRNRKCVAPYHLEAVTHQENVLRGISICAQNAAKTECKRGHKLTPENVRMQNGSRLCRQCARKAGAIRSREWREKNREHARHLERARYAADPESGRERTRRWRAKQKADALLSAPATSAADHTPPVEAVQGDN